MRISGSKPIEKNSEKSSQVTNRNTNTSDNVDDYKLVNDTTPEEEFELNLNNALLTNTIDNNKVSHFFFRKSR